MCSSPSNGLVLVVLIGSSADQNGSGCVYEEDAAPDASSNRVGR